MEIRSIVNEVKNEYPKLEQVSKKHLSNSIPNKWIKVGLSSLGIAMIMKNHVFATISPMDFNTIDIAGGAPAPIPAPVRIYNVACPIVQMVSVAVFIITGLSILIIKIKSKKQNETKKVKKWIKVIFIISIILFILSILASFFINNMYY